jgi:hypothetical protein
MPKRRKKAKAVPFSAADVASLAKANPYVQRLIDDADLRGNLQRAVDSTRSAFDRFSSGKTPAKALLEDKKLQTDLREALEAVRDVTTALTEGPRHQARKGRRMGRKVVVLGLGAGLALVGSEKIRSKVLDTLFGAEEEFEYTPPAGPAPSQPSAPVSAA